MHIQSHLCVISVSRFYYLGVIVGPLILPNSMEKTSHIG